MPRYGVSDEQILRQSNAPTSSRFSGELHAVLPSQGLNYPTNLENIQCWCHRIEAGEELTLSSDLLHTASLPIELSSPNLQCDSSCQGTFDWVPVHEVETQRPTRMTTPHPLLSYTTVKPR